MTVMLTDDWETGTVLNCFEASTNVTVSSSPDETHRGLYAAKFDMNNVLSYLRYYTDITKPSVGIRVRWHEYVPVSFVPPIYSWSAWGVAPSLNVYNYPWSFVGFRSGSNYIVRQLGYHDTGSWGYIGGYRTIPRGQWFRVEAWAKWSSGSGVADAVVGWSFNGVTQAQVTDRILYEATYFTQIYMNRGYNNQGSEGSIYVDDFVMTDDPDSEIGDAGSDCDLSLTLTADDETPIKGGNVVLTSTVDAADLGPLDCGGENVVVKHLLPDGLTYVSDDPSQGSYDDSTGLWTVGDVSGGASATLAVTALVANSGDFANVSEIVVNDRTDIDSTPDDQEGDDYDTLTLVPVEAPLPAAPAGIAAAIDYFYGGAYGMEISASYTMGVGAVRVWNISPLSELRELILPDARRVGVGFPRFLIVNSGSQFLRIKDGAGTFLRTINGTEALLLGLEDDSTQAGVWRFIEHTHGL